MRITDETLHTEKYNTHTLIKINFVISNKTSPNLLASVHHPQKTSPAFVHSSHVVYISHTSSEYLCICKQQYIEIT